MAALGHSIRCRHPFVHLRRLLPYVRYPDETAEAQNRGSHARIAVPYFTTKFPSWSIWTVVIASIPAAVSLVTRFFPGLMI
ncbi:hypothetical protein A1O3_08730 [Capronia epimyces CBS 606.96]|uniref:Uncharacterized protein n=1 Tax=Capronia epimyces CBS 606.96 TaxID=1182542 RepID=W9YA16_9EURO|nr:uncharacterized protein A1O3_08730 [Capronia epimyces CBS 606.96]EXJ79229.1 hypothetical protein A1O3_08730 [Capronia epimyces CBS 606.96]